MTPQVKKEDQECFEDDKVKKKPAEPHKSEHWAGIRKMSKRRRRKNCTVRILEMMYFCTC